MLVAIPLFGREIAPRLGFADEFLIATIENGRVTSEGSQKLVRRGWLERMTQLRSLGIDVILCCGIIRQFIPLANSMGIDVVTGLTGDARGVLADFVSGELDLPSDGDGGNRDHSVIGIGRTENRGRQRHRNNRRTKGGKGCRRPQRGRQRRPG